MRDSREHPITPLLRPQTWIHRDELMKAHEVCVLVPDSAMWEQRSRAEFRRYVASVLSVVGDAFMDVWNHVHDGQPMPMTKKDR